MAKKQTDGNLALEQQRVIVIPAHDELVARKLRVAAYARVSSSSEDQLNSYRVQNQYYSELISSNPDWEMVDIYADEGITGTSVEKREDFQRMMQDCRKGKIDRILVKSISRFARNTKDCLAAVRELKELGVSVQFEEQGIDTSKVSSEMVTAIMASLAQKGSESISGNVQWGYQKRMESGKFNTCKAPYGFTLHEGKLSIIEDEAAVVRFIFQLYLNGLNGYEIANTLSQQEIPPGREMGTWKDSSIYYILKNERYAGKAMVGKSYSTTTFPHKKSEIKVNGKCTCCQIVIRRLYPRKYLTEYRHFYNQEKTRTMVQRTSRSAENCTVRIADGRSNGNLQMIKCIGSAIRISRMQHHAPLHHIIRRI